VLGTRPSSPYGAGASASGLVGLRALTVEDASAVRLILLDPSPRLRAVSGAAGGTDDPGGDAPALRQSQALSMVLQSTPTGSAGPHQAPVFGRLPSPSKAFMSESRLDQASEPLGVPSIGATGASDELEAAGRAKMTATSSLLSAGNASEVILHA
jgi:hypothetical protein